MESEHSRLNRDVRSICAVHAKAGASMPLAPRGRQPRGRAPRAGQHLVHYEDGVEEWLDFAKERVDWERAPAAPGDDAPAEAGAPDAEAAGRAAQEPARAAGGEPVRSARRAPEAGAPAAAPGAADSSGPAASAEDEAAGAAGGAPARREPRRPDGPAAVAVCCNGLRGALDALRLVITLEGGKRVSPTKFERLAGKAASKKWKASLRVDKARRPPPRPPRPARAPALLLQAALPGVPRPACGHVGVAATAAGCPACQAALPPREQVRALAAVLRRGPAAERVAERRCGAACSHACGVIVPRARAQGNGVPGRMVGDWLIDAGLDTPKAPRSKAPSLNALRRRQGTLMRASDGRPGQPGGGPDGKPVRRARRAASGLGCVSLWLRAGRLRQSACVVCRLGAPPEPGHWRLTPGRLMPLAGF